MGEITTLEAARERILQLEDELRERTSERDNLNQMVSDLDKEMEDVRAINQRYYNRLMQQEKHEDKDEEEKPPISCEEFAATLDI